jgi:hypothetical protein
MHAGVHIARTKQRIRESEVRCMGVRLVEQNYGHDVCVAEHDGWYTASYIGGNGASMA